MTYGPQAEGMENTKQPAVDIDSLLERYLYLLDEYTQLHTALNKHQTRMYQDLARANFTAERGMRYGQDFYDDRMQALRRLCTANDADSNTAGFEMTVDHPPIIREGESPSGGSGEKSQEQEQERAKVLKDPLKWFGLLAPPSLRSAQGEAVCAVELVPRIATAAMEMKELEIQVRRAMKKRAKATAAETHQETAGDAST